LKAALPALFHLEHLKWCYLPSGGSDKLLPAVAISNTLGTTHPHQDRTFNHSPVCRIPGLPEENMHGVVLNVSCVPQIGPACCPVRPDASSSTITISEKAIA
jgi:hypothetical protein